MREKKRKTVRERRKGRGQGARVEDKNVDWSQIESRPFITLHLCALSSPLDRLLRFGATANKNRNGPPGRSPLASPLLLSILFPPFVAISVSANRIRGTAGRSFQDHSRRVLSSAIRRQNPANVWGEKMA